MKTAGNLPPKVYFASSIRFATSVCDMDKNLKLSSDASYSADPVSRQSDERWHSNAEITASGLQALCIQWGSSKTEWVVFVPF